MAIHIEQIEQAIANAHNEQSKLTPEVLALEGMSSPKVRHLYNNLGAIGKKYFEIGSYKGCSLISTVFGNELQHFACDNFSEFNPDGIVKHKFINNCARFIDVLMEDCDCWTLNKLPFTPDLYLMDGAHDFESHKKAVTHFFPMMADRFIFVVDDFSHPDFHAVKEGTLTGLEAVKDQYRVVKDWEIWEEGEGSVRFWNGIGIFLIERI